MVVNLSNQPTNLLLQWRHIPSLRNSSAKFFRFREATQGSGWEGYSSIGIGISDIAVHGSVVLIVWEDFGDSFSIPRDIVERKFQAF